MKIVRSWALAALATFCVSAQPAPKPDFSGTWILDKGRSRLEIPVPDSTTFVITHAEPSFRLTRTHVVNGTPDTFSIALTTDGKEVLRTAPDEIVTSRCFWEGLRLHFDSRIRRGAAEATNQVTYSLSADGKTLTAFERLKAPKVKHENVWVFVRR